MADNGYIDLSIKTDFPGELTEIYDQVLERFGNTKPLMNLIGEIGLTSIQRNFDEEGRPNKWKDIKKSTKEARARKGYWPGKILNIHGSSGLYGGNSYSASNDETRWRNSKIYAGVHNFGDDKRPQREFMMLQDEDWEEFKEAGYRYLMYGEI